MCCTVFKVPLSIPVEDSVCGQGPKVDQEHMGIKLVLCLIVVITISLEN